MGIWLGLHSASFFSKQKYVQVFFVLNKFSYTMTSDFKIKHKLFAYSKLHMPITLSIEGKYVLCCEHLDGKSDISSSG
jgi:hypothetical protein